MRDAAFSLLSTTQRRYNRHSHKSVQPEPPFPEGDSVFADRLKLAAFTFDAADGLTGCRYRKVSRQVPGPYRIPSTQQHKLTSEEACMPNTVLIGLCIHFILGGRNVPGGSSAYYSCILQ